MRLYKPLDNRENKLDAVSKNEQTQTFSPFLNVSSPKKNEHMRMMEAPCTEMNNNKHIQFQYYM